MAITNYLKIFGNKTTDNIENWETLPDTDIEKTGYHAGGTIFAYQVNAALRNASILDYALVDILKNSTKVTETFTIGPNTEYNTTLRGNIQSAIEQFIYGTTVKIAEYLGSETNSVGGGTNPVFLSNGQMSASTASVGADDVFIYLSSGTITASELDKGTSKKHVYFDSGQVKETSETIGSATQPMYLSSGTMTACSTYAGGTAVTLNGTDKSASTASFYAPTALGTAGQVLATNNNANAVIWMTLSDVAYSNSYDDLDDVPTFYWANIQVSTSSSTSTSPTFDTVTASTFTGGSDRRIKENIKEYKCKKSILDLPIVEFDFIDTHKHSIGCIAQDLQEICPEIVHENCNGYLTIEETKIVYLLLDEVKKLKEELKEIKHA